MNVNKNLKLGSKPSRNDFNVSKQKFTSQNNTPLRMRKKTSVAVHNQKNNNKLNLKPYLQKNP